MKMGILGAGGIAGTMAATIAQMDTVESWAVAARDLSRAQAFAEKYGFQKAYGSYEEMLKDPELELVYIATLHPLHYEHVKLCLEHGKHVLCEKAFTMNAKQARELFALAAEKKLLLTEAIWTRYIPMRFILDGLLKSGIIGTPRSLTANLCYCLDHKERNLKPELGGGALLDIGIYPLNFACMVFPGEIANMISSCRMNEYGVDDSDSIILNYADGQTAVLYSCQSASSDRNCVIYGTKGYIVAENVNNCQGVRVYNPRHELIQDIRAPKQISGYEYEVEACMEAIAHGWLECPQMPHAENIRMMEVMDQLRADWGLKYPME